MYFNSTILQEESPLYHNVPRIGKVGNFGSVDETVFFYPILIFGTRQNNGYLCVALHPIFKFQFSISLKIDLAKKSTDHSHLLLDEVFQRLQTRHQLVHSLPALVASILPKILWINETITVIFKKSHVRVFGILVSWLSDILKMDRACPYAKQRKTLRSRVAGIYQDQEGLLSPS